jgi:dTMP kinase
MFFSFDGVDGTGKSTQIQFLADALHKMGRDVVTCRDPGSTPLGERLREILLDRHEMAIHRRAEMLLYMTARSQLVEEVIRPALSAGKIVLSDRYLLANVVYQGHAGGLDPDEIWRVGQIATSGIMPRLVFLFDMPAARAALRIGRAPDRMEAQGLEYLEKVRQGFLTEARSRPQEIVVIDANLPVDDIHAIVLQQVISSLSVESQISKPKSQI